MADAFISTQVAAGKELKTAKNPAAGSDLNYTQISYRLEFFGYFPGYLGPRSWSRFVEIIPSSQPGAKPSAFELGQRDFIHVDGIGS